MMSLIQHPDDLKNRDVSHCVVLTRHEEPSAETRALLTSRDLDFVLADDEIIALAQVLLCERLDETRVAWGLRPAGCIVADPGSRVFRCLRMRSITAGSSIRAMMRMAAPQFGHTSGSTAYTF